MAKNYKPKPRKVVIGVILLILALALAAYWFLPDTRLFLGVSIWQIMIGAVLLYWLVMVLFFGRSVAVRLTFIMPLALLFLVFERNIGTLCGLGPNFVVNWVVIVIALLLTVAFLLIFSKKETFKVERSYGESGASHRSNMQDSVAYFDLANGNEFAVSNKMGNLNVFFQNTEFGDATVPVHLRIQNKLGVTTVHVPSTWYIQNDMNSNLGSVDCDLTGNGTGRKLIVSGENELGEVTIVC